MNLLWAPDFGEVIEYSLRYLVTVSLVKIVTLFAYAERDTAQILRICIPYLKERFCRRIRRQRNTSVYLKK